MLQTWTGGDPDDEAIVFTDLSPARLSETVAKLGTPVSDETIRRWMDDQGLRLRKIRKVLAGSASPDRDTQFVRIDEYEAAGNPYFFVDTDQPAAQQRCTSAPLRWLWFDAAVVGLSCLP